MLEEIETQVRGSAIELTVTNNKLNFIRPPQIKSSSTRRGNSIGLSKTQKATQLTISSAKSATALTHGREGKTMKLKVLTTIILLSAMELVQLAAAEPSFSQNDLNAQLQESLCGQNWRRALEIIDQMKKLAGREYASQLTLYRGRIEVLARENSRVPGWTEGCAGGGASSGGSQSPPPNPLLTPPSAVPQVPAPNFPMAPPDTMQQFPVPDPAVNPPGTVPQVPAPNSPMNPPGFGNGMQ